MFGLLGAVQSARDVDARFAEERQHARRRRARRDARQLLVVSEMALSATLVVGATMLVRSVINLQHADLGFEPKGLYSLTLSGAKQRFATRAAHAASCCARIATRLAAIPGVQSVALASTPPGWRSFSVGRLEIEGETPPPKDATSFIDVNQIGSGYFQTMGIRLVQGTTFTDTTAGANQVIVNAGFARKQWRGASAIGHRLACRAERATEPWLHDRRRRRRSRDVGPDERSRRRRCSTLPAADSEAQRDRAAHRRLGRVR